MRKHPARFLYLFMTTLVISICCSGVQVLLSDGPSAFLNLQQLRRAFIVHFVIAYPFYSSIMFLLCLITAGIGWHFDHNHKILQTKQHIKAAIGNAADQIIHSPHYHGPVNHYHFYDGQQTLPSVPPGEERQAIHSSTLPPHSPKLVGRDAWLHDLKQRLFAGKIPAFIALCGLPGVGKTALALELAHEEDVQACFSDGVLWARLGSRADVLASLGQWGLDLGISPAEMAKLTSIGARTQAIHHAIGPRRMLLVIDDAWDIDDALAFKVGGPRCAHLLTTRKREIALYFASDGAMEVHELNQQDGLTLLEQMAPEAVEHEPDQALELVRAVGGLPLALTLLGKYLKVQGGAKQPRRLRMALEQLRNAEKRLRLAQSLGPLEYHSSLPEGASLSLEAVIGMSVEVLDKAARKALRAISVFPSKPHTFSEGAALAVIKADAKVLDTLVDSGLLEIGEPGRYTLHQTIHDYARAIPVQRIFYRRLPGSFMKWERKNAPAYVRMIKYFARYIEDHAENHGTLEREANNILVVLEAAVELGVQAALVRQACAFFPFLQPRGMYQLAEQYLMQAEHVSRSSANTADLVKILLSLGEVVERQGDYKRAEAYLHEGLELARRIDDPLTISTALRNLGNLARDCGEYTRAEVYLREGLQLAYEIHDYEMISALLVTLGAVANSRADYQQAEEHLHAGLALARQIAHMARISSILSILGDVASHQGNYMQAEAYLHEGMALARESGFDGIMCGLLRNLGGVARDQGHYTQAEEYLLEGLALARKIKHPGRISGLLSALGNLAIHQGNYSQAEKYLQEGLALSQQVGHKENTCLLLQNLGIVAIHCERYKQAEIHLQEGLTLARQLGLRRIIGVFLRNLGYLYYELEDYQEAEPHLQEGLALAREINHPGTLISLLLIRGNVLTRCGNVEQAETCLLEGLELARQVGHQQRACSLLTSLGTLAIKRKQFAQAEELLQESLDIARNIRHPERTSTALQGLSMLEFHRGHDKRAEEYLQECLDIARVIGGSRIVAGTLCEWGEMSLNQNRFENALAAFKQAWVTAGEAGEQKFIALACYGIARVRATQGNYAEARKYGQNSLRIFEAEGNQKARDVAQWLLTALPAAGSDE